MLPTLVQYYASDIMHGQRVSSFLNATVGDFRFDPYQVLLAAFVLCYIPFGLRLLSPFGVNPSNFLNIRKAVADKRKTVWYVTALESAFDNYQETVYFFLAAVLGCVQTGVDETLISDYATCWIVLRCVYIVVQLIAHGSGSMLLGTLRTPVWISCLAIISHLMYAAISAHAIAKTSNN